MRTLLILAASATLIGADVAAQANPYVGNSSVGKVVKPGPDTTFGPGTLEIEQWLGQKFIFMPMPQSSQHCGYQSFKVPYAPWFGEIVTVTKVDCS